MSDKISENKPGKISPKQKEFLQEIINYYNNHGYMPFPSYFFSKYKSESNVYRLYRILKEKGYLTGSNKNLKIQYDTSGKPFFINTPYIRLPYKKLTLLGEMVTNDYYYFDKRLIGNDITSLDNVFMIQASDDALKDIGILAGTFLIVKTAKIDDIENNNIVVIKYTNKLLCRIYNKDENMFYSVSPLYNNIHNYDVDLLGKVVASVNINYQLEKFS